LPTPGHGFRRAELRGAVSASPSIAEPQVIGYI
jgi:hypothetical protein